MVCHKRAVVKSLTDRARKLCSEDQLQEELHQIKSSLKINGYPEKFCNLRNRQSNHENEGNVQMRYISTPYISGTSERVNKILKKYDIILSNKPSNTLYKKFNNLKDPLPINAKTNVVYQLNCDNCNKVYIGETRKKVKERVNQHNAAVRNKYDLSLVYKHCNDNNHSINFNDPKVLIQNNNVRSRLFLESFFTNNNPQAYNRCIQYSEIYAPTVNDIISKIQN